MLATGTRGPSGGFRGVGKMGVKHHALLNVTVAVRRPAGYLWGSTDREEGDCTRLEGDSGLSCDSGVGLCLSKRGISESGHGVCKGPGEASESLQEMPCRNIAEQESQLLECSGVTSSEPSEPSGTATPSSGQCALLALGPHAPLCEPRCLLPGVVIVCVCFSHETGRSPNAGGISRLSLCT